MHYQELTLIPASEIPLYAIWEKIYAQLHIGFADIYNSHGINSIGVSFPGYRMDGDMGVRSSLGNKLRLIAPDAEVLALFGAEKRLARLTDYVHIKSPAPVPADTQPLMVRRYRRRPLQQQAKDLAAHLQIPYAEALAHCRQHRQPQLFPPFIRLKSLSNEQSYPLLVLQTPAKEARTGTYTAYGFSVNGSTVPGW